MSTVKQDVSDRVLHIALNRPDKRSAINDEMFDELVEAAEGARTNTDLGASTFESSPQTSNWAAPKSTSA